MPTPAYDSNRRPPAFTASVLPLDHEGLTAENDNIETNMKYFEVSLYKGIRQKTSGIGKRLQNTSGIDSISQCRLKSFQFYAGAQPGFVSGGGANHFQ